MRPIVLIHGAWHGGWCFDLVAGPLRERGFDVQAPDLPFTGAAADIRAARDCIAAHPGAVVLGHSYGGVVITHASAGLDVSRLVYLCAFMPDQSEDPRIQPAVAVASEALQAAMIIGDDGTVSIDPELGVAAFYHDCPATEIARAGRLLRPMAVLDMPVLEGEPPWKRLPSTYVICTDDRALHPNMQRALAQRASETVTWDVAHSPFFATPGPLVELLAGYASSDGP